jgi:hypothetical protein
MHTVKPPRPPRQRRSLARRVTYTVLAVLGALVIIAIITGALSGPPAPARPAAVTPSPRTSSAVPLVQSPQQKFEAWHSGPGWADFQRVHHELPRFDAATQSGNEQLTEADGALLARYARVAARHPAPVATGAYTRAMTDFARAGQAASRGDFTDSAAWFNQASENEHAAGAAWNRLAARS